MNLGSFQQRIGYSFQDTALLRLALAHRSVGGANNERLEFLGDAALGFIIARRLYEKFPEASESDLSLMRVALVRGETLAAVARELELGPLLALGEGERKSGGWERDSILADAVEAVIGAVVCDGGIDAASDVVERLFTKRIDTVEANPRKDPKTLLQEKLQADRLALPDYRIVSQRGRDHARVYVVECRVDSLHLATSAEGRSRREAEKEAALKMLEKMERSG